MATFECTLYSNVLQMNAMVRVLMPDGIQPNELLKVLYLYHGYMGNHTDWTRFSSIERYTWGKRLAVVMPAVNNSYYTDMAAGFKYFTFVADELPALLQAIFPFSTKREDNFVAGLSMGGYGAMKVALTRPDKFGAAASLSGALDANYVVSIQSEEIRKNYFNAIFGDKPVDGTPNDLFYLIRKNAEKNQPLPRLYFACGTEDFLYQSNLKFKKELENAKVPFTYVEGPGAHEWWFWDLYIQKVIEWLYQ